MIYKIRFILTLPFMLLTALFAILGLLVGGSIFIDAIDDYVERRNKDNRIFPLRGSFTATGANNYTY